MLSKVLGGLQARIRHHPILNLVNKIIELSRLSDVELWIIVIECRADDEIGLTLISSVVAGATSFDDQEPVQEDGDKFSTSNDT